MRLSAFLHSNEGAIVKAWETFAREAAPAGKQMSLFALRDHIPSLLRFIAEDIESAETELEKSEKSKGRGPKAEGAADSAAEIHGELRFISGFDTVEMISEFRALRASVVKLWSTQCKPTHEALHELTAFNESIDQAMTESLVRYTEKLNRSRSMLLGTLVHDLRSPLSAVSNSAQVLLLMGSLNPRQTALVSQVAISTSRVNRLVSDLIDAVRVRLGKGVPISRAAMEMGEAVVDAVKEVRAANPGREISVEFNGNLEGVWDRARVGQILSNLLGNAVQHGVKTSPITVAAKEASDEVILSVHNEGWIHPETLATIFDPLMRGKDAEIESGTASLGLGLYIAQEIVHAHDGEISVTSNEREGTTFIVNLPRRPPAAGYEPKQRRASAFIETSVL